MRTGRGIVSPRGRGYFLVINKAISVIFEP